MEICRFNVDLGKPTFNYVWTGAGACMLVVNVASSQSVATNNLENPDNAASAVTLPIKCASNEVTLSYSGGTLLSYTRYYSFWVARPGCVQNVIAGGKFNTGITNFEVSYPSTPDAERLILSGYTNVLSGVGVSSKLMLNYTSAKYQEYAASAIPFKNYQKRNWNASFPLGLYDGGHVPTASASSWFMPFRALYPSAVGSRTYGTGSAEIRIMSGYYYGLKWNTTKTMTIKNNLLFNSGFTGHFEMQAIDRISGTQFYTYSGSSNVTVSKGSSVSVTAGTYNEAYCQRIGFYVYKTNALSLSGRIGTFAITYRKGTMSGSYSTTVTATYDGSNQYLYGYWVLDTDVTVLSVNLTIT